MSVLVYGISTFRIGFYYNSNHILFSHLDIKPFQNVTKGNALMEVLQVRIQGHEENKEPNHRIRPGSLLNWRQQNSRGLSE